MRRTLVARDVLQSKERGMLRRGLLRFADFHVFGRTFCLVPCRAIRQTTTVANHVIRFDEIRQEQICNMSSVSYEFKCVSELMILIWRFHF